MLATPYSEAVGQSVASALFKIARKDALRPNIPIEIWAWLNRRPFLPPAYRGRMLGTTPGAVHHIRGLGDIEILKSYFLLAWSEWNFIEPLGLPEIERIIGVEFRRVGMRRHREDLTERLDHILGQLDRGVEYFRQHIPRFGEDHVAYARTQYTQLKEVLAELDRESMKTLSRKHPNLTLSVKVLILRVESHLTILCAPPFPCP